MKFAQSTLMAVIAVAGSTSAFTAPATRAVSAPKRTFVSTSVDQDVSEASTVSIAPMSASDPDEVEQLEVAFELSVEEPKQDVDCIVPGRYGENDMSVSLPFLKRPTKLDGSHAGDFGFDPLGLTEEYDLYTMQEAEIRHARLAMLAVVGWPLSELVAPKWMLQEGGCAPSVLNGFNPLSAVAVVAALAAFGVFELKTALRNTSETELGKKHLKDMSLVWKYGVAGDYNFDPFGLYSSIGDSAVARKGLRDVEISHGRVAMLGITYFALWEKISGHAIVENNMLFHPNLLFPALVFGYFAFNQVYEIENDDQYIFQIRKTSEGEARLENLSMSMRGAAEANKGLIQAAGVLAEKAVDLAKKAKAEIDERNGTY